MAYQDSSTFNMLSESSVDDLNRHINDSSKSVTVDFFRPNIVVSGVSAFDEVKLMIGLFFNIDKTLVCYAFLKIKKIEFVGGLVGDTGFKTDLQLLDLI